jgi:glycosyltransferase involved in cell wall biosynthesis
VNICIVSSGDFFSDYGGGQVYVRNLVDELVRRRGACENTGNTDNCNTIETSVISFAKGTNPITKDYKGIKVYQVINETTFRDALQQIRPDLVHANGEKLMTARLCKELGIPCVVTAHHGGLVCPAGALLNSDDKICNIPIDYSHCLKCYLRNIPTGLFWYPLLKRYSQERYNKIGQRLERLPNIPFLSPIGRTGLIVSRKLADWKELAEIATHFIAPSDAIAEALERNGCPKDKITVIPHGIPIEQSSSSSPFSVLRSPFINFYYVGRINYVKGVHILLKAFSSIDNPTIRLHIIGGAGNKAENQYWKLLKKQYRKDSRIIWHGKVSKEQMSDTIKDFHCLVHPTICLEVFGLNIAEAQQSGKYVIATRCGGAEMQIRDNSDGLLVEPNDVEALATALKQYISTPKMATTDVENTHQHIEKLINLYHTVIQQLCQL